MPRKPRKCRDKEKEKNDKCLMFYEEDNLSEILTISKIDHDLYSVAEFLRLVDVKKYFYTIPLHADEYRFNEYISNLFQAQMPKYYRFRATTPTRRPRKCRERDIEKSKQDNETRWLGLTLAARQPAPSWYLRRTSWRESPPLIGFLRQLAEELGAPLQLSDRKVIVFKIPSTGSQELIRQFY